MAYDNLRFCWHAIIGDDLGEARAFYTRSLGWKAQEVPMGDESIMLFIVGGQPLGHLSKPLEGVPNRWNNYLRVEDVDASTNSAIQAGGTVSIPPTDIAPGRVSIIASPSGAVLALFREADPDATNHPGGDGSIYWTELQSHDIAADLAFLETVFGFGIETRPMPKGGTYNILTNDGVPCCGAVEAMLEEAPSAWFSWVQVEDADATVERVEKNGGKKLSKLMDYPGVGRMALVTDSTGAVFGLIKPEAKKAS